MSFFKTTVEVKQYINIDVNTKFDRIKPDIDDASERCILPLLGNAFYEELETAYLDGTLSPQHEAVLPYVQRALANYAAFMFVDGIGVQVGDLGIQQQFNQNSQPAPAWKVASLRMKYITTADAAADKLLEFLEQNASPAVYGNWFADLVANTAMSGCIVYKTSIASKYIDINNSRRIFLRLKKRIKDVEESYVRRLICNDQYDEIVTQLRTGSLTPANEKLVERLEPFIAKKALYLSLPSLAISIEPTGIMMYGSNDSVVQKQIAGAEDKKQLMLSLREGDFGYEADAQNLSAFIKENIADYPLISGSPCYNGEANSISTNDKWVPSNNPCNKHFSV